MTPHDNRFSSPPPIGAPDPESFPAGLKLGDSGFIEALAARGGFVFIYRTKPADDT